MSIYRKSSYLEKTNLGVLAAGSAEGAVGRHGDGVKVAGVTDMVGLQLAVGQVPDLDQAMGQNSLYTLMKYCTLQLFSLI